MGAWVQRWPESCGTRSDRQDIADVKKLVRRLRKLVSRRNPLIGVPDQRWVRTERNPPISVRLQDFEFLAVLGTWYESDVIEATVANAFDQGCSRVLLVDNESPDDTVERAVAAGAELARSYHTDTYDEGLRMQLMHDVVDEVSAEIVAGGLTRHVWWLWLDADEFHHGPSGITLRSYLSTLDERFRVVGARCFDHYPDSKPEYVSGHHPLEFQPLCHETVYPMCAAGHRKHPLLRWDSEGPPVRCGNGFHLAACDEQLVEPETPIFLHHFPYRAERFTTDRLNALCGPHSLRASDPNNEAYDHIRRRFETHRNVYEHRWRRVRNYAPGAPKRGVDLCPWLGSE